MFLKSDTRCTIITTGVEDEGRGVTADTLCESQKPALSLKFWLRGMSRILSEEIKHITGNINIYQ